VTSPGPASRAAAEVLAPPAPATAGDGLRTLVLRGIGWKIASQVTLQVSRLAVGLVLARLLSPHDYGLAGMVLVFSTLVLVFSDLSLGAALVQRRTLTEEDRSTVFWTAAAAGAAFTVAGIAVSGPIAEFYGEPAVQPLFAALSLSFVVTALAATQRALLMREMNFRSLELRLIFGTLAGGCIGIALAAAGYGPWAIIGQQLAIAVVSSFLLWHFSPWRPRLTFSVARLRDLGGFSANVFGQRLLYYLHLNSANLLVGRVLGASALGVFSLAYNVMFLPFNQIAVPIAEVMFPAFSRIQDERQRIAEAWARAVRLVGAVTFPSLLGLMIVAPDFVAVVLGGRWSSATPVIQVLAWVALLQSLQTLNSNILQALDRTTTLLRYMAFFFVAHLTAFVVGLHWGIVGVAVAYAISTSIVEPLYNFLSTRALGTHPLLVVRALSGVVQASLLMVAVVLPARLALVDAGVEAGPRLAFLIALGAAVYVPACAWRAPEVLAEVRRLRRAAPG
jgi:O-antigen/teichoic acid export membrane protein